MLNARNERGGDDYHGAGGPLFVSDQTAASPSSHAFVEAAPALQLRTNADFNAVGRNFDLALASTN